MRAEGGPGVKCTLYMPSNKSHEGWMDRGYSLWKNRNALSDFFCLNLEIKYISS